MRTPLLITLAAAILAFTCSAMASELIGGARDDWWGDVFTGGVADVGINPIANASGHFEESVAHFQFISTSNGGVTRLLFSRFNGTSWQTETVLDLPSNLYPNFPEATSPTAVSLEFKSNGLPGIAFGWVSIADMLSAGVFRAFHAHFVEKTAAGWQFTTGNANSILEIPMAKSACFTGWDNFGVNDIDLAFTTANVPCILLRSFFYTGNGGADCTGQHAVKYSENRSVATDVVTSSTVFWGYAGIAMNRSISNDLLQPAIAYDAPANPGNWRFRVKTAAGNNWGTADFIAGRGPDIEILSNGTPVASFTTGPGGSTFFGKRISGSWQNTNIAGSASGYFTSIGLSPLNGNPTVFSAQNIAYTYRSSTNSWIYMGDVLGNSPTSTSSLTLGVAMDPGSGMPITICDGNSAGTAFLGQIKRLEVDVLSDSGVLLNLSNAYSYLIDSSGNLIPYVVRFSGSLFSAAVFCYTMVPPGSYTLVVAADNHKFQSRTLTFDDTTMLKEVFVLEK